ncbi:AMP-binding protein [Teichococcus cervicalis]|uniref:Long-chain-fatty-acid--CoA ligase n=1 Tax=Pseudoroseomonas cervicalis ATCC 49957 TaxID=525371 RepID=D5RL12_9PROT|nr:AMP-binding protein [Pseudoroseomonas cervicalis]EFH11998.1 putative dicarboxylate--CoA ligase PimA [Pseudoroseomonas cervicalis ATCC 49957]
MGRPHPWEASYPAQCRWDAPIAAGTLTALLRDAAARGGDRPALVYRDRAVSFRLLEEMAERVAAGLLADGLRPGEAVALYLPNTPWHPACFFGVLLAGGRVVHLSPLDAPRELLHKIADSGARCLITTDFPTLLPNAARLLKEGGLRRAYLAGDAAWGGPAGDAPPDFAALPLDAAPPAAWPELSPDDIALLQYTGGTTGKPKGAMLTHRNLTAAVSIYRAWQDEETLPPGEHRVLGVLPLFHIYMLAAVFLRHLADGNTLYLYPRFEVAQAVDEIERHRITNFPGVPTMWIALLNLPGIEARDLSSLRQCSSGGAPMPFEVQQKLEALIGCRIGGGWGMTETSPAGARLTAHGPRRPGLIGLPLPGVEMRVVALDDPGRALPPGEHGEIAVRGPNVFQGYWKQQVESAAAFRDGWFLTGDLGWMDEGGYFTLVDRRKNMIISSGFNVYPAAIEQAIYEHPDVEECLVIGVPDAYRGQAAKAFVKLRDHAPVLTLDALRGFLADRIGRHEMPAALELRAALPRSAAGKLLAARLRDEEEEQAARSAKTEGTPA